MWKQGEINIPPCIALEHNRALPQNGNIPTDERHAGKRSVRLLRKIENFPPARQLRAREVSTGIGMFLESGDSDCFVLLNRWTADLSGGKVDRSGQSALCDVIDDRLPDRHSYCGRHKVDRTGWSAAGHEADRR